MKRFPAGRMGDAPARGLSKSLARAGFKLGRLQTGTPARLDARTVNLEGMEVQEGDADPSPFSFLNTEVANRASHSVYIHRRGSLISRPVGEPSGMLQNPHNPRDAQHDL